MFIVFFAGQAILTGQHINIAFSHPGVVRALFGAALYLTVMGLFGLGLGAIVRSTAGGIATLAAIVFVLPPIIGLLPTSVSNSIDPYLPSNAGGAVWTIHPDPNTLAPWAGFGVFCAYAAVGDRDRRGAARAPRRVAARAPAVAQRPGISRLFSSSLRRERIRTRGDSTLSGRWRFRIGSNRCSTPRSSARSTSGRSTSGGSRASS